MAWAKNGDSLKQTVSVPKNPIIFSSGDNHKSPFQEDVPIKIR